MTSDFDNEEIEDSTFPVEFNEDTTALDMYGVWVKNGPRDVIPSAAESFTYTKIQNDAPADHTTIEDISDLPDLPDFSDFSENTDSIESDETETLGTAETIEEPIDEHNIFVDSIEFENIVPDSGLEPVFSEPVIEKKIFSSQTETVMESQFDLVDPVEFIISEPEFVEDDEISPFPIINDKITFEEVRSDELVSEIDTQKKREERRIPVASTGKPEKVHAPDENRVFEEIQFTDIEQSENPESISSFSDLEENAIEETENLDTIETLEFDEAVIEKLEASDEKEQVPPEEIFMDTIETAESLDSFELIDNVTDTASDESSFELLSAEVPQVYENTEIFDLEAPEELPSDADFSSFLDDLNTGSISDSSSGAVFTPDSGDLDLDSFIDSFNESGGTAHDEKAKIFDDTEPVDIELDFDESFIADSEKIKATGSAITESEFFDSVFGVEMIDETATVSTHEFDSSFETVSEFTEKLPVNAKKPIVQGFKQSILEETDEFNDLLNMMDLAPSPSQSIKPKDNTPKKMYDLAVTEEDGFDSPSTVKNEKAVDEIDVSLFFPDTNEKNAKESENTPMDTQTHAVSEEDFLDISDIKDYNNTESDTETEISVTSAWEEPVSLDFDDISAVEQELNDFTPDTGDDTVVNNDKSTELLMIIADELSSIKQELSTLKTELAGFKTSGFQVEPASPAIESENTENSGFFTDDDTDETIALTGDELNNILITADFTEEKNDEAVSPELDANFDSILESSKLDLTGQETEFTPGTDNEAMFDSFQDTITDLAHPDIPETLPDSIFEIPDLDLVNSISVAHVNNINEDTSYLEGSDISDTSFDDVAIDEPELEIIDFNDEKLEEPELTEFNIDLADINNEFPSEMEVTIPKEMESEETVQDDFDNTSFEEIIELDTPETRTTETEPLKDPEAQRIAALPVDLKEEIKSVLSYMDQLLESLPEDKIEEFARSEHFEVYKKLFEELGIT